MEQSIRRSELEAEQCSLDSSPELLALERLKQFTEFEFIQAAAPKDDVIMQDEDDELTFRLFAPGRKSDTVGAALQTVRIHSPTPDTGQPGFMQPERPRSYYFSSPTRSEELEDSAVSFDDIQRLTAMQWPGMNLPWKVLTLPCTGLSKSARQRLNESQIRLMPSSEADKRRRPGKKARIKLRVKLATAKQKAVEAEAAQEAKDAAERDKKTRRNREKKAKKRQRDKLKKAGQAQDNQENDTNGSSSDDDGDAAATAVD